MGKTDRVKKPYRPPVLTRYGDLRTLTGGGFKKSNEAGTVQGPKTKLLGGG